MCLLRSLREPDLPKRRVPRPSTTKVFEDKEFLKITRRVNAWRHQGVYCYLYYPVTRLIGYFAALIGVGWGILLLSVYYDWTFDMLWPVGAVAIGIVFIYAIARRAYEIGQEQQRDKDEENSPPA